MAKYVFGVDVGGTTVKMGFFGISGDLFEKWEIPTRTENEGKYILGDIASSITEKLAQKQIDKSDVWGIGMGVPGPVGADGIVYKCVNLGWGTFNVEKELSELVGLPVKAGNDANVAALGEMWMGGGKGYENLVMVTLGTGVGGGVIVDGKILPGANGAAGEFGHMPVREPDDEPEACGCGKHGCLEQYTSANGVARMARKWLVSHDEDTVLRSANPLTSKEVFDAAKEGDAAALLLVEDFGRTLGKALAEIACVVNPQAFVIGGGMAKAGSIVTDVVQKYFEKYAFHASEATKFELATLGNDAGIYGGVKMLL